MLRRVLAWSSAIATLFLTASMLVAQAPKQKPGLEPAPVNGSELTIQLHQVGTIPVHANPTSPAVAGTSLLLIDQTGYLYRWDGTQAVELISPKTIPNGVKPAGVEHIVNAATNADGSTVYVMFISSSIPRGVPSRTSPREPDAWFVLYAYEFDGQRLGAAKPVTAMQVRTDGHIGGGMTTLPDGSIVFVPGDNGDAYEDGRDHPQNPATHLGKIVRIDPSNGAITVVAAGVRGAQRLSIVTFAEEPWLVFADPGGWIAEEVNAVRVSELLGAKTTVNFGWGRNADGKAREGTFYVDRQGNSLSVIPPGEIGFVDPLTEFGREGAATVAISGPVASRSSFARITLLFGDLASGTVFAVTGPPSTTRQAAERVNLTDATGRPTTLRALAGDKRPDPRFFNFPDGAAGVLLEASGAFYRLDEARK